MNLIHTWTPNQGEGANRCEVIIIHWWNRPELKPSIKGIVSWFQNPASQVSAHYVVSDETVYQLVSENDRAWHAMQANDFAIGIEVDPNTPGKTYETVAELVRQIRQRHGNIPLKRHRDYVNTDCPGTIDVERIDKLAKGEQDDMKLNRHEQRIAKQVVLHRSKVDDKELTDTPQDFKQYLVALGDSEEWLQQNHKIKTWDDLVNQLRAAQEALKANPDHQAIENLRKEIDDVVKAAEGLKK